MYNSLKNTINKIQPIDDIDWGVALPMFEYREAKKRDLLLKEGHVCKTIDFIVEGSARIYINYDGKDVSRQFFFENGFIAELSSFLTQKPSLFSIDAIEDCKLLSITKPNIDKLYSERVNFLKFGKKIGEHIAIFNINRNVETYTLTAKQRYLRLIEERPKVMSRVPLHMIASYIGITPEALSRIRKEISTFRLPLA
jgi:CRP/FNR family transcriptional regulator, anaerobic regulatory protein